MLKIGEKISSCHCSSPSHHVDYIFLFGRLHLYTTKIDKFFHYKFSLKSPQQPQLSHHLHHHHHWLDLSSHLITLSLSIQMQNFLVPCCRLRLVEQEIIKKSSLYFLPHNFNFRSRNFSLGTHYCLHTFSLPHPHFNVNPKLCLVFSSAALCD